MEKVSEKFVYILPEVKNYCGMLPLNFYAPFVFFNENEEKFKNSIF